MLFNFNLKSSKSINWSVTLGFINFTHRHVADIRADDMDKDGQGVIGLQMGSNKGASQQGMSMGSVRHVADIRADDASKEGSNFIGGQVSNLDSSIT